MPAAANRTFELGGPDAPTWNEFWDRLKRVLGSRRPSIHLPVGLMRAQAALTEKLPGDPVTRDQLTMLVPATTSSRIRLPSRRSSCRSSLWTSSSDAPRREPRPRLRRGRREAGGRGDHRSTRLARTSTGPRRGVRRAPHRPARRRDRRLGMKFPILLGHEAAGVVEEVGEAVTFVKPGDRVVIAWRAPCGDSCRASKRGDPRRCSNSPRASGAWIAPRWRSAERRAALRHVRRPRDRARSLRSEAAGRASRRAGVPDCLRFSTGAGPALWATPVEAGSSVAVIGCGGVGLAVIQGAGLRALRASSLSMCYPRSSR